MGQDAFALLKAGAKTKYERPSSKYPAKRQRTSETGQPSKRVDQLKSQRQVENATDTTARHSSPHAGPQAKSGNKHEDFGPQGSASTPNDVPKLPARNAFSILSASAEKAFQAHYFYCGLHDGQWRCEIWPVGQANPRLAHDSAAWSAQARVTFKPRSAAAAADEAQAPQSAAPPARQAEVRLRSNVAPGNQGPPQTQDGRRLADGLQQPRPPGEAYTGGAPLLKSALQKCVRRRLPRDAARLAHALLAASPSDALRRVAVMAAEDAAVHPHLPAVVWMMMAVAKGFALTADHTALIIRVVSDLAGTHVRDALPDNPPASAATEDLMAVAKALPGDAAEPRALVSCLLLRAAYGGMAGDVSMLHAAAAVWLRRFQEHLGPHPGQPPTQGFTLKPGATASMGTPWDALWTAVFPAEAIPWTGIHHLRRRDFPLAGVDHHISRILTPLLSDDTVLEAVEALADTPAFRGEDPEGILGSLLWKYRSGISRKHSLSLCSPAQAGEVAALAELSGAHMAEEAPELAKKICSLADEYSVRYIARSFS